MPTTTVQDSASTEAIRMPHAKRNDGVIDRVKSLFTAESFWKERMIGILGVGMYFVGNVIEIATSPTHTTTDPPAIWITGFILSIALLATTLVKNLKKYVGAVFKPMIYFVCFNSAYLYICSSGTSSESVYLFVSYATFVVTSQMFETRRELLAITLFEIPLYLVLVYFHRDSNPVFLQPMQMLMFAFVMTGNYVIGIQRMKLTQISGGSSIQFRAISHNARDMQSVIDGDFKMLYVNPAVKEITGFDSAALAGKEFLELVVPNHRGVVQEAMMKIKENPVEKQSVEYRVQSLEGQQLWVETIFSHFETSTRSKEALIFAETRNIETRKQMEEAIQQQLRAEEMLIKHSNQFINVGRTEIQHGIELALAEFGNMLGAEAVMVYRMFGKLQDEFRSTNRWMQNEGENLVQNFNSGIKINQQLISFLRTFRKENSSRGNFFSADQLFEIQVLNNHQLNGKQFYLIPLQSGNIVNGFVVFIFPNSIAAHQSSFFGLIGNMLASAFTRSRTEMRLHEAQMTNEAILRALPDWLYIVNRTGEFTGSNNASTLPDYLPDYGLIGKTFSDVLPEEIAFRFSSALQDVIEGDTATTFEYNDTTIYKGRYFKAFIAPFKANEFLVIIRDITDLKMAQNELLLKAKNLEQSNKELEEFAYVVSHDMKQPIRTIISYLTLLKKKHLEALNPEAQEFVNFSIDGANKMSELIRDILQYSRMDQQISFIKDVSLTDVVEKVLKNLQGTIMSNQAEVIYDRLPHVNGNETMLTELFQNLIENGIKYNLNADKKIRISVKNNGSDWLFEVGDNGIGFEQQYAEQIFKIFKRLHTDGEFQGTGIGLTICHKVVEKHAGKIWAESEKGKGSTFHFTLPKQA